MRRSRRGRRNPFNQPKPAEWATMSKASRKAWNRKHWRPHEYMVVVPLKRYATRKSNQRERGMRGGGFEDLAAKIQRMREAEEHTNPPSYRKLRHKAHRAEKKRYRREARMNPKHPWDPDAALRAYRRDVKRFDKHTKVPKHIRRAERDEGREGRRGRNPSTRSKVERELVYAIGDWLSAEQEQGQARFYERMDSSPRNRLLMKTVWTLAHQIGITTRPQLDAFKAKHAKQLAPLLA